MRKVKQLVERLPSLRYIILTDAAEHLSEILSFSHSWKASTDFKIPETNPEDAALLHFTSGTTGMPKAFYMCIMLFYPLRKVRT
jgi:acetyl-CoA synthetase